MSQENIIRAWKDASFRDGLSESEQSLLPEHPVGLVELNNEQLGAVAGARPLTDDGRICSAPCNPCS
jgi:mersacidin/lichenicidin family type 2 lantibiotic